MITTVGELRAALEGHADDTPVFVIHSAGTVVGEQIETVALHVDAELDGLALTVT
jgi:hypothetical protein